MFLSSCDCLHQQIDCDFSWQTLVESLDLKIVGAVSHQLIMIILFATDRIVMTLTLTLIF